MKKIPVITVDGGAAVGKGAVASVLAKKLNFNYLDSGVYYRALAYASLQLNIRADDVCALEKIAANLCLQFVEGKILWIKNHDDNLLKNQKNNLKDFSNEEISQKIRSEACGERASEISHWQEVRLALLQSQRSALKPPGLIAEGRDMGTVVFPEASVKLFLNCDVKIRAQRRLLQLENQGINGNISEILQGLIERDKRDIARVHSPLKPAKSAEVIDTTKLSLEEVINQCWQKCVEVLEL